MSVQASATRANFNFILSGESLVKDSETLLTDAARATVLKAYTVMAQIAATKKWVPLTDVIATDGSCTARGILLGDDITAAALVAGDVTGQIILVGGRCTVDSQLLVLENALTVDSVVAGATVNARRIEDDLANIGIFVEGTRDIDVLEN
jgi:hypothetical protein